MASAGSLIVLGLTIFLYLVVAFTNLVRQAPGVPYTPSPTDIEPELLRRVQEGPQVRHGLALVLPTSIIAIFITQLEDWGDRLALGAAAAILIYLAVGATWNAGSIHLLRSSDPPLFIISGRRFPAFWKYEWRQFDIHKCEINEEEVKRGPISSVLRSLFFGMADLGRQYSHDMDNRQRARIGAEKLPPPGPVPELRQLTTFRVTVEERGRGGFVLDPQATKDQVSRHRTWLKELQGKGIQDPRADWVEDPFADKISLPPEDDDPAAGLQ